MLRMSVKLTRVTRVVLPNNLMGPGVPQLANSRLLSHTLGGIRDQARHNLWNAPKIDFPTVLKGMYAGFAAEP